MENPSTLKRSEVTIRQLREEDLGAADHVMRLAFGTFRRLPEPEAFMGDAAYIRPRWKTDPSGAYCAELNGQILGSNLASNWGSVGFFGPLTVHPDYWEQGIGKKLIGPMLDRFRQWHATMTGLFTFADSPKHLALYQKFGFWPRFLTLVMSKAIKPLSWTPRWSRFSEVPTSERNACIAACRKLTDSVYSGLDVTIELREVAEQGVGDAVLLWDDNHELAGLAVCQSGPGSEGGSGVCYIKFGIVRSEPAAEKTFTKLLLAAEALGGMQGASRLIAGVNTARHNAYQAILGAGFRVDFQGIVMQKPDEPGYNRPDVFLIDDWR